MTKKERKYSKGMQEVKACLVCVSCTLYSSGYMSAAESCDEKYSCTKGCKRSPGSKQ